MQRTRWHGATGNPQPAQNPVKPLQVEFFRDAGAYIPTCGTRAGVIKSRLSGCGRLAPGPGWTGEMEKGGDCRKKS